jgi:hypothetical protein
MKKILLALFFILTLTISAKNVFAYTGIPFTYSGFSNSTQMYRKIKNSYYDYKLGDYFGNTFVNKYGNEIGFGFYILKDYNSDTCALFLNMYHLTRHNTLDANIAYGMYKPGLSCDSYSIDKRLKRDVVIILNRKNKLFPLFQKMDRQEKK